MLKSNLDLSFINNIYCLIFLIILMTLGGAFASLFFKKGSGANGLTEMLKEKNLYIGGMLYVITAFINILVLKFLDLSLVLPLTAITYIWTLLISKIILKEKLSKNKIIGVIFIIIGVVLLGLSDLIS